MWQSLRQREPIRPTAENARVRANVEVRANGTKRTPATSVPGVVGQQRSRRIHLRTNTEHDPLLEGQPVEYIKHVGMELSNFSFYSC